MSFYFKVSEIQFLKQKINLVKILVKEQCKRFTIKITHRASLVVQWLRIYLPMQGTRVRALFWEDPTCHGATKPACHNYWACAVEPTSHSCWAYMPQLLKPVPRARALQQEKPRQWEACMPQLEKAHEQQRRLNAAKNK